jgi:Cof subfamily protein (haloacid dehalogenase superfamily)
VITVNRARQPVRLLATDLDGTLLRSDNTVSDFTRSALGRAEESGLIIAFVTGRPPRWLHEVAQVTGHRGIAISANGAITYDLHTETVIDSHLLDQRTLSDVAQLLRARIPQIRFAVEHQNEFSYEPGYAHDWQVIPTADRLGRELPRSTETDLAGLLDAPAVKLIAKGAGLLPDEFMDDVQVLVGQQVTVTRSGHSALVEISAAGVTKASGLAALAEQHRVDRQAVAAVGDMPNDVPMLEWAGWSYAVANAHSSALAAAQTVLGRTNDEDAVGYLLTDLLDGLDPS